MTETNGGRRVLTRAALIALLLGVAAVGTVDAGTVWIEWDRSPDPAVVGYRVSVGTSPSVYTQTFDVGSETSFVYQAPDARLYYLAVASYAAGGLVGPLSDPLSAFPVGAAPLAPVAPAFEPPDARSFYEFLWRNVAPPSAFVHSRGAETAISAGGRFRTADVLSLPSTACWTPASECLAVRTLARRRPDITSLAASGDGRVFFVEANQRIGVIASGVLQPQAVLASDDPDVQLTQVLPDADFASTGLIYVGETGTSRDGGRELRIVRYRVDQNQAVEPDLVATIPLPAVGEALFSITSTGELSVRLTRVESR